MSRSRPTDEHPPVLEGQGGEVPPVAAPMTPPATPPVTPWNGEALAAQAQALEGMRRLHMDLADRLEAGDVLRSRVDRVSDGLEDLRSQQSELRRAVERPSRWRLAVLLCVLALGVVGGVWSWERWADDVPLFKDWRQAGGRTQIASLVPGGFPAESDAWSGTPLAAEAGAGDAALSAAEIRELRARAERAEDQLASAREERNKQLGENARLRQQLVEKQLQMDSLRATVNEAVAEVEARRVLPVPSSRTSDRETAPLLTLVNEALRGSGLVDVQMVEVGRVDEDAFKDVLVREFDRISGRSDIYPMRSAQLSVHDGLVSLVLTPAPSASGEEAEPVEHVLTTWNPDDWSATGLSVPVDFVPVNVVMDALDRLLYYHPYELVSLGGFEAGELRDLQLRQMGPEDTLLRTLTAGRAVVNEDGPELMLYEGVITEDGIDRPFWRGQSRLPLPGSDYAAWVEVTGVPGG